MIKNNQKIFLNLPFGEDMASQHSTTADFSSRYKFNSLVPTTVGRKELDRETGYYYYGARYYDLAVSQWLSINPLAEKYQGFSPYNFTLGNPVRLVDVDGKGLEDEWIVFSTGETKRVGDKGGDKTDYITKVNKDGSITNIEQAAGKMKESEFFKTEKQNNIISNRTTFSNMNIKIDKELTNKKIAEMRSNYGDKIRLLMSTSANFEIKDDKKATFNPYIETNFNEDGDFSEVGGGIENSFYSFGGGIQKGGIYLKSSILGFTQTNSMSISNGFSTTFGYSKDHITTSYTMSVKPGGGAVIAVLIPVVISQPELAPVLLSTP